MTAGQIEAEVLRVAKLVREHLHDASESAEAADITEFRIQTWMVGTLTLGLDEDGDPIEHTSATYETSSRIMQIGIAQCLASDARATMGA